jgi:nucleotide-binding universal stress UspA family protein
MIFSRILVAIDDSEISRRALDKAVTLALATDADLNLLHVLPLSETGTPNFTPLLREDFGYPDAELYVEAMDRYTQRCQELHEEHLRTLRSLAYKAETAGVRVEMTQTLGDPSTAICSTARSWRADLIIMGRRGRKGLSELFLGSTSNYVLHHAPCAVLVVQEQEHSACEMDPAEQAVQV